MGRAGHCSAAKCERVEHEVVGGGRSSAERLVGQCPCGVAKKMSESCSVVHSCIRRKRHCSVL